MAATDGTGAGDGAEDGGGDGAAPMGARPIEEAASPLADGGRGKRRRGAVDYKALEEQLKREEAEKREKNTAN